jgi:RimJ/RimL family protein N-acetyltransferase
MYNLVPFDEEHIHFIETDYEFPPEARAMFNNHHAIKGYSLFNDDLIMAAAGVHILWGGVAEGWIVMSKHGYSTPKTVARYTDRLFDGIMADNELWRIQASVSASDTKALRFASWLGFEDEGLMKKYGPDGSDYRRVARFALC